MAVNFKTESEVQEYLKNLGIEYRFGCYSEKKPEVCHLLADYLEAIKKDFEKAGKVYKHNCDDYKFSKSCLKFGTYNLLGRGIPKPDYKTAYDYYSKGCSGSDDPECCLNQGLLLVTDNKQMGIEQDISKGMELLEKACTNNNANACYYLSGMYIAGVKKSNIAQTQDKPKKEDYQVQPNMNKAFRFALEGCNLGNMYSCANLSQMYAKGDGVEKNSELAAKYKTMALEMQNEIESSRTLTFQEGLK